MLIDILLLILFAGVPYYLIFEKTRLLAKEKIFLFAAVFMIVGLFIAAGIEHSLSKAAVIVALLSSLYTLIKANATTNLYKIAYYILFFNAPMLLMFDISDSFFYGVSLLVSLSGIFFMARFYEKSYGSANYRSVSGITSVTPYAGLFLTIYFTALALYPPFPNSLFFLNVILNAAIDPLWYIAVVIIFFGNFLIAVRVMAKTVFGKPNPHIHYIDITPKQKLLHGVISIVLAVLSVISIQELL